MTRIGSLRSCGQAYSVVSRRSHAGQAVTSLSRLASWSVIERLGYKIVKLPRVNLCFFLWCPALHHVRYLQPEAPEFFMHHHKCMLHLGIPFTKNST